MGIEGTVLAGRYAVDELLGRGGMAEVYGATDRVLDRPVAVKVLGSWLANDGSFLERFRREALAAARISHPGLVAVYDAGSEGDLHFIVMELVPGTTLAEVVRHEGPLPADRATMIAARVGDALAVAHAAGIVHRDVKPANVMLTPDGRVKLMDLGIARGIDEDSITRASSILGTAGYISPEQARGVPVDHRSDIYSLGCVLYEMLTGRQPFEADNPVAVAYQHVHETPATPRSLEPAIPPALESVTLRAMEKDPEARFSTAADMTAALEGATGPIPVVEVTQPLSTTGSPVTPPTGPLPRRSDRPPQRRRLVPLLIAVVVLALVGSLAFALLSGDPPAGGGAIASPSRSVSPSPSPSSSSSPSPSPSPSPSEAPALSSLAEAVAALQEVVADGVAAGRISSRAEEEIRKGLDHALERFAEGDTERAIEELARLEEKVDELLDHDEIHQSQERRIDSAIEDLASQMLLASPPEDD